MSDRDKSSHSTSKMKYLAVFALALACVAADVYKYNEAEVPIVRSDYDISPEGSYQYGYETGNGIVVQAQGVVKNQNSEYPSLAVTGTVKYTAPDGTPIELSYVADEEGFKPVGRHLPVPPEIPEAIARSIAYIEAHPPKVNPAVVPGRAY